MPGIVRPLADSIAPKKMPAMAGLGGIQVRRCGTFTPPGGSGGGSGPGSSVAKDLDEARRDSVDTAIRPVRYDRSPKSAFVMYGGTGTQGGSIAHGASLNFDSTHEHSIVVVVRGDLDKAQRETRIKPPDGKAVLLADQPGVMFVKDPRDCGVPPGRMNVLSTTPSSALPRLLQSLPPVRHVMATYNGTPPSMEIPQPSHGISMLTSRPDDDKSITYDPGGSVTVGQHDPMLDDLRAIFSGAAVIAIHTTADVHTEQWNKIGLNTALNSLATIFGETMGALGDRMASEPAFMRLVQGMVQEVHSVALKDGASTSVDTIMKKIMGATAKFKDHPTSMGAAFRNGKETEEDVLSGGVAALARAKGLEAPLCTLATTTIKQMQVLRGTGPVPPDFEQRHAQALAGMRAGLLAAARETP